MYLYNSRNILKPFQRESIKDVNVARDEELETHLRNLGYTEFEYVGAVNDNAFIILDTAEIISSNFERHKELVNGIVLYHTLVDTNDICYIRFFNQDMRDFSENGISVTDENVLDKEHFKRLYQLYEFLDKTYNFKKMGNSIYYKNLYLLENSYIAPSSKKYELVKYLNLEKNIEDARFNNAIVKFKYNNEKVDILVRKNYLLYKGIMLKDIDDFFNGVDSLEDILTGDIDNSLFIDFVNKPRLSVDTLYAEESKNSAHN